MMIWVFLSGLDQKRLCQSDRRLPDPEDFFALSAPHPILDKRYSLRVIMITTAGEKIEKDI